MLEDKNIYTNSFKSFFTECLLFIRKNKLYAVITGFVLVLSYGFYGTKYTFNLDQLVPEYYDGNVLITAGRWSAPLIHRITNWMEFSPFWHTVLMMLFFWLSGLCWVILFKKVSENNIGDKASFVFWLIYPIFPMFCEQLTYPVLNIALAYVLTPVSIYLIYETFFENCFNIKNLLIALVFITISIDMYESFAPVFLTGICAALIVNYLFGSNTELRKFSGVIKVLLKTGIFLLIVIALDILISKIICYISSGSFEFWYNNNSTTKWFSYGGLIDSIVWFFRDILTHYVIMSAANISVCVFDIIAIVSLIIFIILSIKKRSGMPLLFFILISLSSVSLAFIKGAAPFYRMEQALPLYVAFLWMLIFKFSEGKKLLIKFLIICTTILVLNESQTINNYAVLNYEMFEYSYSQLRDIGKELKKYDTSSKPVVFIRNKGTKLYPEIYSVPQKSCNPTYNFIRTKMCNFWDFVLTEKFYKSMNDLIWSETEIKIKDCNSLIAAKESRTIIFTPYQILLMYNEHYLADGYIALKRMGYDYIPCTEKQYKEAQEYLVDDSNEVEFLVTEIENMIIVQLMPA